MEFNVEGADVRTGRSRIVRIEAENEQDAEAKAHDMGLLVSHVFARTSRVDEIPLKDPPPPRPDHPGAAARPTVRTTAYAAESSRPIAAESAATHSTPERPRLIAAPEYEGLRAASLVLHMVALLSYLVGLIALCWGIYVYRNLGFSQAQTTLTVTGVTIVGGAVHGMSASCDALRDIAQNSFRK